MKKRILSMSIVGLVIFSLVGCSLVPKFNLGGKEEEEKIEVVDTKPDVKIPEKDPVVEPEVEPEVEPKVEPEVEPEDDPEDDTAPIVSGYSQPDSLSDDIYSYSVSIDDTIYVLPMYVNDFLALGWKPASSYDDFSTSLGSNYYTTFNLKKGDTELGISVCNWDINSRPASECVVNALDIWENDLEGAKVTLPGGINFPEATFDDITAAYGTPSAENWGETSGSCTYAESMYNRVRFTFDTDDNGKPFKVSIENFVQPEDFVVGEISDEIPKATAAYVAPTEMSDKPEDFIFELQGDLYKFPCPVREFVDNGWEIVESKSAGDLIEGLGYGKVTLRKDNFEFWTYVDNYDKNATSILNCFVNEFSVQNYSAKVSIKMCGGVEYMMDKDTAGKLLEPLGFVWEENETGGGHYNLEIGSYSEYSVFINKEGKVQDIYIENAPKRSQGAAYMGVEE